MTLEIWDTAGQEIYQALAPMYYRGSQAAIIVYSIADRDTLARAKFWVSELKVLRAGKHMLGAHRLFQRNVDEDIIIAIVGNKCDLADQRQLTTEVRHDGFPCYIDAPILPLQEGRAFADSHGYMFFETSAKTNANINELFAALSLPTVVASASRA